MAGVHQQPEQSHYLAEGQLKLVNLQYLSAYLPLQANAPDQLGFGSHLNEVEFA